MKANKQASEGGGKEEFRLRGHTSEQYLTVSSTQANWSLIEGAIRFVHASHNSCVMKLTTKLKILSIVLAAASSAEALPAAGPAAPPPLYSLSPRRADKGRSTVSWRSSRGHSGKDKRDRQFSGLRTTRV